MRWLFCPLVMMAPSHHYFLRVQWFLLLATVTSVTTSVWLRTVNWLMILACNFVLPNSWFKVAIHLTFDICCNTWPFGQRGLGSNWARPLPDLQVVATLLVPFLQVYYTLSNEVVGYDMACQVGKVYNIFSSTSWFSLKSLDIIKRSWPFFESELVFFGPLWRN